VKKVVLKHVVLKKKENMGTEIILMERKLTETTRTHYTTKIDEVIKMR
jgi:hypothetical protein